VADYRRDRTAWDAAAAAATHTLSVDLGADGGGLTRPVDTVFLDRGHTLWGLPLSILPSADGVTYTDPIALGVVPARTASGGFVPGGNPTAGWCVTEEGACYRFLDRQPAARGWRLAIDASGAPAGYLPRVTGLVLGVRHQLFGFSDQFDDDSRARKQRTEESDAGYLGGGPVYTWRTADLSLRLIGDPEYDGVLAGIRALMFDHGQPGVLVWDYGARPERAWMGTYDGPAWGFAKRKAYREGRLRLREHGHRVLLAPGALAPVPPAPPPSLGG
jgi:hypothetical protein